MFRRKAAATLDAEDDKVKKRRRRRRRRRKKPGSRRSDLLHAKDNMLADEGSSAYKDWLARTTLLEDIYRHYDNIAQSSENTAAVEDHATFEGGEVSSLHWSQLEAPGHVVLCTDQFVPQVTGFALTHSAATPHPALSVGPGIGLGVGPGLAPASFNLPVGQVGVHPGLGLSLASSINSFAAPALGALGSLGSAVGLPGPAASQSHAYGPPSHGPPSHGPPSHGVGGE